EDLRDVRSRFGNAFDESDRDCRGAEHGHEIDRQQRVDHLRRDVHEHADEAESPNAPRERSPQCRPRGCVRCHCMFSWRLETPSSSAIAASIRNLRERAPPPNKSSSAVTSTRASSAENRRRFPVRALAVWAIGNRINVPLDGSLRLLWSNK